MPSNNTTVARAFLLAIIAGIICLETANAANHTHRTHTRTRSKSSTRTFTMTEPLSVTPVLMPTTQQPPATPAPTAHHANHTPAPTAAPVVTPQPTTQQPANGPTKTATKSFTKSKSFSMKPVIATQQQTPIPQTPVPPTTAVPPPPPRSITRTVVAPGAPRVLPQVVYAQDGTTFSGPTAARPLAGKLTASYFPISDAQWPAGLDFGGGRGYKSMVFDGEYLWMVPGSGNMLVRVRKSDGALTGLSNWPEGMRVTGNGKFNGGTYDGARYIYLAPQRSKALVRVDKNTGIMTAFTNFPMELGDNQRAFATAIHANGKVFLVPRGVDDIVVFDPADGSMTAVPLPADLVPRTAMPDKFFTAAFDGAAIWLVPYDEGVLLRFDVATRKFTGFSAWPAAVSVTRSPGQQAFAGAAFDGFYLWLVPSNAPCAVRVATADGSGTMTAVCMPASFAAAKEKFRGGFFDGKRVWMTPHNAPDFVTIDALTDAVTVHAIIPDAVQSDNRMMWGATFDGKSIWAAAGARGRRIVKIGLAPNGTAATTPNANAAPRPTAEFAALSMAGGSVRRVTQTSSLRFVVKQNGRKLKARDFTAATWSIAALSAGSADIPASVTAALAVADHSVETLTTTGLLGTYAFKFACTLKSGGIARASQNVTFLATPLPEVNILGGDRPVTTGTPVTVYASVSFAGGSYALQWSINGQRFDRGAADAAASRFNIPGILVAPGTTVAVRAVSTTDPSVFGEATIQLRVTDPIFARCTVAGAQPAVAADSQLAVTAAAPGVDQATWEYTFSYRDGDDQLPLTDGFVPNATLNFTAPYVRGLKPGEQRSVDVMASARVRGVDVTVANFVCSFAITKPAAATRAVADALLRSVSNAVAAPQPASFVRAACSAVTFIRDTNASDTDDDKNSTRRTATRSVVSAMLSAVKQAPAAAGAGLRASVVQILDVLATDRELVDANQDADAATSVMDTLDALLTAEEGDDAGDSRLGSNSAAAMLRIVSHVGTRRRGIASTVARVGKVIARAAGIGEASTVAYESLEIRTVVVPATEIAGTNAAANGTNATLPASFAVPDAFPDTPAALSACAIADSTLDDQPADTESVAPVVDLGVTVEGGAYTVKDITAGIDVDFRVPSLPAGAAAPRCRYYNRASKAWATDGLTTVSFNPAAKLLRCRTTHFTLFAALAAVHISELGAIDVTPIPPPIPTTAAPQPTLGDLTDNTPATVTRLAIVLGGAWDDVPADRMDSVKTAISGVIATRLGLTPSQVAVESALVVNGTLTVTVSISSAPNGHVDSLRSMPAASLSSVNTATGIATFSASVLSVEELSTSAAGSLAWSALLAATVALAISIL